MVPAPITETKPPPPPEGGTKRALKFVVVFIYARVYFIFLQPAKIKTILNLKRAE
jgi:hypothetical protein